MPAVLVVDDDLAIQRLLEMTLAGEGYEVRLAANGREALDALDGWLPDVILLDLMMPVMDGRAFRAAQRALAIGLDVPVIVLSAARDGNAAIEELGAAGGVEKPFDPDDLLLAIQSCLEGG